MLGGTQTGESCGTRLASMGPGQERACLAWGGEDISEARRVSLPFRSMASARVSPPSPASEAAWRCFSGPWQVTRMQAVSAVHQAQSLGVLLRSPPPPHRAGHWSLSFSAWSGVWNVADNRHLSIKSMDDRTGVSHSRFS